MQSSENVCWKVAQLFIYPTRRLIKTTKSELGKISKIIIEKNSLRSKNEVRRKPVTPNIKK